jgi:hypothetical protein
MTEEKKTQRLVTVGRTFSGWILTLAGVLAASGIAGAIAVSAGYGQRIARVETQVEELRRVTEKIDKELDKIQLRGDRMEAKIDELLKRGPK